MESSLPDEVGQEFIARLNENWAAIAEELEELSPQARQTFLLQMVWSLERVKRPAAEFGPGVAIIEQYLNEIPLNCPLLESLAFRIHECSEEKLAGKIARMIIFGRAKDSDELYLDTMHSLDALLAFEAVPSNTRSSVAILATAYCLCAEKPLEAFERARQYL